MYKKVKRIKTKKRKYKKEKSSSLIEQINPSFQVADSLMLAYMAYSYLRLWLNPEIGDAETIFQFAGLMGFEFIMVHSGVFMAALPARISLLVFVPAYGLFAWAFNEIIGGGNIVFYIYMFAVFNRMRFAFFNVNENLKNKQILASVFAAMSWFFLAFAVAFGMWLIPDFGLSYENLERIGYFEAQTHGGLFLDVPKTAICLGFLYYFFLAIYNSPIPFGWLHRIILKLFLRI